MRRAWALMAHDPDNIDHNVKRSLEEKRRHIGERRYRRKDGSVILVDTKYIHATSVGSEPMIESTSRGRRL